MNQQPIKCANCGSKNMMQDISFVTTNLEFVKAEVLAAPNSWLYNQPVRKNILGNICADCGEIKFHLAKQDARELWEVYQKTKA